MFVSTVGEIGEWSNVIFFVLPLLTALAMYIFHVRPVIQWQHSMKLALIFAKTLAKNVFLIVVSLRWTVAVARIQSGFVTALAILPAQ